MVIDELQADSPSRVAAGIMNPVTGRRLTTVWMAEEILSHAPLAYQAIGDFLGIETISRKDILDFFPNPFMRESFLQKANAGDPFVSMGDNLEEWSPVINAEFGYGIIHPVYTAHLENLLPAWRKYLLTRGALLETTFELDKLEIGKDAVVYKDIRANRIIFCEGPAGMQNPFFEALPFARNKGQAFILRIPDLPDTHIYKKSMLLVPLRENNLFWLGASYEWEFESPHPTADFREKTENTLKNWLKLPWEIIAHKASLRPATLERRPFVGMHPLHKNLGIFNGMGTKGCSLSPYFAQELTQHLLDGKPLTPEADVKRFSRILSRN